MLSLCSLGLILLLASGGRSLNDTECPVRVPGYFHHGDCNLLCRPARWTDVIVFYLSNYVTHAATVISRPGERPVLVILGVLAAVLFPGGGLIFGVETIFCRAVLAPTQLQTAARAGALCYVRPPYSVPVLAVQVAALGGPNSDDAVIELEPAQQEANTIPKLEEVPKSR